MRSISLAAAVLLLCSCKSPSSASTQAVEAADSAPAPAPAPATEKNEPEAAPSTGAASLGQPAPDFSLPDLAGEEVSLSQFKGKVVVLEWFNPECPFVKAAHTKGSLVDAAERAATDGVVWLAVNSGAPGKQGHGAALNQAGVESFGLKHPVLLDPTGQVGRLYGAERTPHLFVVSAEGILVYAGAVDNSPDGEGQEPTGGELVSYVDGALAALSAGKPVQPAQVPAYGCSVKYAK